ncbi:MAG: aspartate aminotransferase family protein [Haloarculaceae archaeon]
MELPETGRDDDAILAEMAALRDDDADWRAGRTWSLVYHLDDEHKQFKDEAHALYSTQNALSPSAFPSLRRFENEIVGMLADWLGGDEATVGNVTTGGTESILLAVKTARDWAREERGVATPHVVLPETAHPAFSKAAHYFGVEETRVACGPDWRADPDAMAAAVRDETALLVASSPSYPHGVVDPVPEIAAIADERDVLCHVDACIGGIVLASLRDLGRDVPPFDLSVEGVTSLSVDPHKYGYTAKGASTLLWTDADYRYHQYFAFDDWPGGVYAGPTMAGTRPGGPIAAAWAVLQRLGHEGYLDLAATTVETAEELMARASAIDGLAVVSDPDTTIFALESTDPDLDVYQVHGRMTERGWGLGRQQEPPSIHASVMYHHRNAVDEFVADLEASVAAARESDRTDDLAPMYGTNAEVAADGDFAELARRRLNETTYRLD